MKFERIARELYGRPWAITPSVYGAFHDAFQRRLADGPGAEKVNDPTWGTLEYAAPYEYQVQNGVAVIDINGALGNRLTAFDKACIGAVDYADIRRAIEMANNDPKVEGIVLNINSPGGMVNGLEETAQAISDSDKVVVGFTDGLAASAGYYLMAGAHDLIATGSSDVGCIGTLMTWVDLAGAYEQRGYKRELISSGKFKGMLMPGLSLTDEQRELLQDEVDTLAQEFKDFVESRRGGVADEYMEGQTVTGKRALEANLIDQVGDLSIAIETAQQGE